MNFAPVKWFAGKIISEMTYSELSVTLLSCTNAISCTDANSSVDSTNSEHFATPMAVLVETIYGTASKTMLLPGGVMAFVPTQPLAITMLDSLTIHAKMRLDMHVYSI